MLLERTKLFACLMLALMSVMGISEAMAGGGECQKGNVCIKQKSRHAVGYEFLGSQGGLGFSDNGLALEPVYGPGYETGVRLIEEEGRLKEGVTNFGEWQGTYAGYVTTAEGGEGSSDVERGLVRLYERSGGYQIHRLPAGMSCAFASAQACEYERHGVNGDVLLKVGEGELPLGWGLTRATRDKVRELLNARPLEERRRAYVRSLGDGEVEVYGQIRPVEGGYEAWLSGRVDVAGMALEVRYELGHGVMRLERLVGADGLTVRLYYGDTEPLAGEAFSDASLDEETRRAWREVLPMVGGALPWQRKLRVLPTSWVGPGGQRWRFDYEDALTGLRWRDLARVVRGAVTNANQGPEYVSQVLMGSGYMRLVSLVDAVGVESQIRYACGGGGLVSDTGALALRRGALTASGACLGDLETETGQVEDGTRPLYRRVSETEVGPYGVTRYSRIFQRDGSELKKGWVVENGIGQLQRFETVFSTPSAESQLWMSRYLTTQHPEVVGDKPSWVSGSYDAFWSLLRDRNRLITNELLYRNSFYWSAKAIQAMGLGGVEVRNPARRLDLDKAVWTHYLHDHTPGQDGVVLSSLVMATHAVEEGWVWMGYPNQQSENEYRASGTNRGYGSAEVKGVVGLSAQAVETEAGIETQTNYVEYNDQWKPVRIWDAQGRRTQINYLGNGLDVESVRIGGLERSGGGTEVLRMGYNDRRQVLWRKDARGNVTCHSYSEQAPYYRMSTSVPLQSMAVGLGGEAAECANPNRVTSRVSWSMSVYPEGSAEPVLVNEEVTAVDGMGRVSRVHLEQGYVQRQEVDGVTTTWEGMDAFGRPMDKRVDGELKAHYEYEALHVSAVSDGSGHWVLYGVDGIGRVQGMYRTDNPEGMRTTQGLTWVTYDASGGVATMAQEGELAPQVTMSYDVGGRVVTRQQQDGVVNRLSYQARSGRIGYVEDALGVRHEFTYNREGKVLERRVTDASGMVARRVTLGYGDGRGIDPYGRILSVTDNGRVSHYQYRSDDPSLLLSQDEAVFTDLGVEGTRVTTTVSGYDARGRLEGWRMSDTRMSGLEPYMSVSFGRYGRVKRIDTEVLSTEPEYEAVPNDRMGGLEPIDGTLPRPGGEYGRVKGLSYNLDGREGAEAYQVLRRYEGGAHARALKAKGYYLSGNSPYTLDGLGNPMPMDVSREFRYASTGQLKTVSGYWDDTVREYDYDRYGHLNRSQTYRSGVYQSGESYHYDGKGNRTGVYELDAAGMEGVLAKQEMGFGWSNRLSRYRERGLNDRVIECANQDQQGHDRMGRLAQDPTRCEKGEAIRYTWDAEGNLNRITYPGSANFSALSYAADGHLLRKVETGNGRVSEDLSYVWMGNELRQIRDTPTQRLLKSFNADGMRSYSYDGMGNVSGSVTTLFLRDQQGSVIGLANQNGQALDELIYDDWGNIKARRTRHPSGAMEPNPRIGMSDVSDYPFGYGNYLPLPRANLYLAHHRVYHPSIGRFISQDPIKEHGGQNLYAYTFNNPNNLTDPSGLVGEQDTVHAWMDYDQLPEPDTGPDCLSYLEQILRNQEAYEMMQRDTNVANNHARWRELEELGDAMTDAEFEEWSLRGMEIDRLWQATGTRAVQGINNFNTRGCSERLGVTLPDKATAAELREILNRLKQLPQPENTDPQLRFEPNVPALVGIGIGVVAIGSIVITRGQILRAALPFLSVLPVAVGLKGIYDNYDPGPTGALW